MQKFDIPSSRRTFDPDSVAWYSTEGYTFSRRTTIAVNSFISFKHALACQQGRTVMEKAWRNPILGTPTVAQRLQVHLRFASGAAKSGAVWGAAFAGVPLLAAYLNGNISGSHALFDLAFEIGIGSLSGTIGSSGGGYIGARVGALVGAGVPVVGPIAGLIAGAVIGAGVTYGLQELKLYAYQNL